MKELRIGILGGCMNAPMESVGKSDLYHQVAARDLEPRGLRLRVSLRSIDDYRLDEQLESLRFLAETRTCEVLVFQIRPTFLRQASVVFWKDRSIPGRPRLRLSPFYTRDLNEWSPPATLSQTSRFADLDHLTARLTGLRQRAQRQVRRQLRSVVEFTGRCLGRPLLLLGPIYNQSLPGRLGGDWRRFLDRELPRFGVPVVDLSDLSLQDRPDVFEPEGFHLNPVGHELAGRRLAQTLLALGT